MDATALPLTFISKAGGLHEGYQNKGRETVLRNSIFGLMALLYCSSAGAEDLQPITCKDFTSDMQRQAAEGSNGKKMSGNGFSVNIVALGSYLSSTGKKFADLSTQESENIYVSLYLTCQDNPLMPAIDAAVLSGKNLKLSNNVASAPSPIDELT